MKSVEPTRVLAIDDDADICFYIREILERNNCNVTLTERGRDALQLLSTQTFDIVMADVRLPDLDGVSILEHLRLSGSEIPFVLITGFTENEPIISSIRLGAIDYLTKPFSPSELEASLQRALDQKKRLDWSRLLYQITDHKYFTLHEKIQNILHLTTDMLNMTHGFIVHGNTDAPTVRFSSAQTGLELEAITHSYENYVRPELPRLLGSTAVCFHEAESKARVDDQSWAAVPLRVNQQIYGAVCFAKPGPRKTGTLESERSVMQLTEFSLSRLLESEENAVIIANQQSLILAAQNLSSLGELATSIVHEIENHLTIIAGRTVMVGKLLHTESKSSNSKIKVALDSIGSDVKRIDRIVKSVRTIAHDSSQQAREHQMLQISNVLDEALELFRCKIKSRSIRLTISEIPPQMFILGDPTQLLQVFLILLNNSFDAIEGMSEEWIHVSAQVADQSLLLSVTDSGPGIPAHLHERIFTPFFTTKNAGKGVGVGLNLARKFVEAHSGKLWIDPGSPNTRFVVQLFHLMDKT